MPRRLSRPCAAPIFPVIFAIFSALAVLGCGGGPGDAPDSGPGSGRDASGWPDSNSPGTDAEIGTGTTRFEPLDEDQPLTLYAGPQGGHHFIVHARMQGMEPGDPQRPGAEGNPVTTFRALREDGRQVDLMLPPYVLGYRDQGDGWYHLPSGRLLIIEEALVPSLFGQRMLLQVHIRDAAGRVATDQRWIVATAEPDAAAP